MAGSPESGKTLLARVQAARNIQLQRFSQNGLTDIICNADMRVGELRKYYNLFDDGQSLMRAATCTALCDELSVDLSHPRIRLGGVLICTVCTPVAILHAERGRIIVSAEACNQ